MKKATILLSLVLIVLPLISYAATEPSPLDKVMEQAAISGLPVETKGEGSMIYKAFPDYGKSKCRFVHGTAWKEGTLVDSKIKEVCNRDFRLPVPYVPHHIGR